MLTHSLSNEEVQRRVRIIENILVEFNPEVNYWEQLKAECLSTLNVNPDEINDLLDDALINIARLCSKDGWNRYMDHTHEARIAEDVFQAVERILEKRR